MFSATIFLTAGESSLETGAGSFIVSTTLTSSVLGFSIIGSSSILSTIGLGSDFFSTAAAPSAIAPKIAPTSTVSPSFTLISVSCPDAGAGTSNVTLSVSNSSKGSSMETASPILLYHRAIVASVTDSPNDGTFISTLIIILYVFIRLKPSQSTFFAVFDVYSLGQ